MEIKEFKERKLTMENDISNSIYKITSNFKKDTGYYIDLIDIVQSISTCDEDSNSDFMVIEVTSNVEI